MPLRNIVVIAVAAIISLTCYSAVSRNRYANLYSEALEIIEREALLEFDRHELFDASMQGMLSNFDRNSAFISGRRYRFLEEDLRQKFGGVGMYVDVDPTTNELIVLAPMPNSPASRAGLLPGDVIAEIEGQPVNGDSRSQAIELMRGEPGAMVRITIRRAETLREVAVTRQQIPVESVHGDWRSPDGKWDYVLREHPRIGYIRLLQFGDQSTAEFEKALSEITDSIDGLIIDLRNNSGGLLESAVAISDLFLPPKKMIVETRGRNERVESRKSSSEKLGLQPNIPIVILINRNSASASEIVAASLQDHGRATIVGERSYGKGTVQNLIPLERNISAIKLTTASYWRPSGRNIDRVSSEQVGSEEWGVSPDPGRLIEMEEEEVFENYRKRHLRDLAGIHQATGFVAKENLGAVQAAEDLKKREPDEPGDNADPLPTTTLPRDEIEQDAENDGPMPDGPAKTGDAEADAKSQEPNELKKYDIDRPMQMAIQIILGSE